jgi:GntR family transcriptional regulator
MVVQYRQIADDLRRLIAGAVYPPGACLPPEAELAAEYGVSRGTVRQAVITLQLEGLLDTQSMSELQSFAQWAARDGRAAGGLILRTKRKPASADEAAALAVAAGDPMLHLLRLRTLDGDPTLVERIIYPPWIADAVAALPRDTTSLTDALTRATGIAYGRGRHTIDAVAAGTDEASLLGIRRGSAMLRHRYVVTTASGRPFVSSDDRYKPGTMAITLDNAVAPSGISRQACG